MGHHFAEWDHCFAALATARTNDEPPVTVLLMLLNLVEGGRHIASLKRALVLRILDDGEGKQTLALTHGHPARGAVQLPLPVRDPVYVSNTHLKPNVTFEMLACN